MKNVMPRLRRLGAVALVATAAGCTDFLTVPNPTVINAAAIDPVNDLATLAGSAQQSFAFAYGLQNMYSGWFTGEIIVAETFPTRNEFGRRDVVYTNGSLNTDVWFPMSQAMAQARAVLAINPASFTAVQNQSRAQAAVVAGYLFEQMAETFCAGTVGGGPKLTTANMIDSAIANFSIAIGLGQAANATATTQQYKSIAFVGRARANLQKGATAAASADADSVPAGFSYSLPYIDDLANRTRLANTYWQYTRDRGSISVASTWRTGDPRVTYVDGATIGFSAQDPSSGTFWVEQKWPGYGFSIRLASKLETDYIKAEASGNTATQLALIAARRTAAGQPAYAGPTDAASVLKELLTQKGYDFWLEGKRIGDFRRNPGDGTGNTGPIIGVPVSGTTYFKPGFAPVGTNTCYPVPFAETTTNKNYVP